MPTLGELVSRLEAQLFVGRERELALFEQWLTVETAPSGILNVSGPSGVGKSALLQAFRRSAEQLGRPVILADAHDFPATPAGLLQALGCEGLDDIQARLNEAQPLIMLDTFEQLGHLTSFLQQELLPRLDSHVKLVIAGRHPLAQVWRQEGPWHTPIRSLPLGGLSPSESRTKLERRGVREAGLVEQILQATGGYPLALSLAADMVVQFGARDFTAAPEWHLVLRTLVERLLDEAADPVLRALLEACAVVRHFDQDLLEIVAGRPDSGPAFRRLCQLSVVRPSEHGLMLHDDVRRILAEDLRWRRPDRHAELRLRALAYYRERTRSASPSEREWLLAERFYLWQDAIGHGALFGQDDPGDLWLDPGRPDDHAEVLRLEAIWLTEIVPTFGTVEWPPDYSREAHFAFMEALLRYPGLRLRIAREPGGRALGFNMVLPICRDSIELLERSPIQACLLHACHSPAELDALPPSAETTNVFFLLNAVHVGIKPEAVQATLMRDPFSLLALGGVYLASAGLPAHKRLLDALGFEQVAGTARTS